MTSALETIDATTVKITVHVTEAQLAPIIAHAYEHLGEKAVIPGFRKGKVPPALLQKHIAKGAAIEHAINEGLGVWYSEAVEEHDLRPVGPPEIDLTRVPGLAVGVDDLEFTAIVEIRPAVALPKLDAITLKVKPVAVDETDVTDRLDALRARFGTLTGVDRPAANGDFVTLDLAAEIDGTEVDAVQGTSYEVGSGSMLDGLDEAILGLSSGEETTYEGPLAAGEHAGAPALVRVKVTAVKERELPAADDAFAQLASEFDTIAELKEDLRKQAGRVGVTNQAVEARTAFVEHLKSAASFELPSKVIEREVHQHLEGEGRLADDVHRAEVTEEATEALRVQILLDQLADDLDLVVEEEELLDYMITISRRYGMDPEEFIQQSERAGRVPQFVSEVARSKAVAYGLRKVTVKDTSGKAVDLSDIIGSEESDTAARKIRDEIRAERAASKPSPSKKPAASKPAASKPAAKKPVSKK